MNPNTTILIVDDSNENLKLLGNSLKKAGFTVLTALSGKQSIALAQSKQPDLILMDVMMPEMNGFAACIELKNNPLTSSIPLVFLTASDELEKIKTGFDVGAVDYITKPFNPAELIVRVNNHIKQKNERDGRQKELNELLSLLKNLSNGISVPVFKLLKNTDLLTQHSYPEPFKSRVENIQSSGKQIMRYASGISDLSKLQGSEALLIETSFELSELFKQLKSSIESSKYNLVATPTIHLSSEFIGHYSADKNKLIELLLHLLSSVSQSNKTTTTLNISSKERTEGVEIFAIDIIGSNYESSSITHNELPDQDIHLLLASELLRLLSGKVIGSSFSDERSIVTIEFPLRYEEKNIYADNIKAELSRSSQFLSGIHILIAEDNDLNQYFLENVLQRCGAQTTIAHTGTEALEKVTQQNFHLILMDLNLPELNGIEVTRRLKKENHITCPIIAISGHNDQDSFNRCMEAGMSAFLLKPFSVDDIYNVILEELAKVKIERLTQLSKQNDLKEEVEINKYSLEKLIELSNGDKSLTESWIKNFKGLVSRARIEIGEMLESKEYKTGTKIFHDLNNYASYFGVDLLREYLKDIPHIHKSLPIEDLMDHFVLIDGELADIEAYFNDPKTTESL